MQVVLSLSHEPPVAVAVSAMAASGHSLQIGIDVADSKRYTPTYPWPLDCAVLAWQTPLCFCRFQRRRTQDAVVGRVMTPEEVGIRCLLYRFSNPTLLCSLGGFLHARATSETCVLRHGVGNERSLHQGFRHQGQVNLRYLALLALPACFSVV